MRSENVTMNYVSWYMVCYVIAAYIRMYPKHIFSNTRFWGGMTSGCLIVSSISVIFCAWYFARTGKRNIYYFVSDCNKLFAVATAVSAFLFFKNMKMKYNRLVNTIAASTFGVLQIHANSDTMRRWLWQDMLNNVNMYDSRWLVVHAVGSVIVVFLICTGIDYLRIQYLEKTVRKITWNLYQRKHNCV